MSAAVYWNNAFRVLAKAFLLTLLGLLTTAQGQTPQEKPAAGDPISGRFEGMVKSTPAVDSRLTLEILSNDGKLSGRLITPQGTTEFSEANFSAGKLTVKLGTGKTTSTITAQLQDDKLVGEWVEGQEKRTIELKRAGAASGDSAPLPLRSEPVSLAGEWDGLADTEGGFPFTLTFKVDGEKVTGQSNSSLGVGTITNGTWKDGKLVFQIDSPSGPVAMNAVIKDGGLVGEFDFAGQVQGRWVAKKKTP